MKENEEFILFKNERYIVHREINGIDYIFGKYDNKSDATKYLKQINDDGWPISKNMPILKKSTEGYIHDFIEDELIQNQRDVSENDPNINFLYRTFKEYIKEENTHIPLKTFKYYFPRLINKKLVKREFINGSSRYNISFKNHNEKSQIVDNKSETPKEKKQLISIHRSHEIVPRIEQFLEEKTSIKNRKTNEYDPTIDDICKVFNNYLKEFNESIQVTSFSMFFSQVFTNKKNSDKNVINGKTRYNISLKPKSKETNTKNNRNKLIISEDIINDISIFKISGNKELNEFEQINSIIYNLKDHIYKVNIERKNNNLYFIIEVIINSSKKTTFLEKLKKL